MSRLTRDGTAEPVSRDQILRHARGQGNTIFPVQLTTSRIGNLTRLIHTLLYVMTIHTYIHTYIHTVVWNSYVKLFCTTRFTVFLDSGFGVPAWRFNLSVQYNGGLLPDIILLARCGYIGEPF